MRYSGKDQKGFGEGDHSRKTILHKLPVKGVRRPDICP